MYFSFQKEKHIFINTEKDVQLPNVEQHVYH